MITRDIENNHILAGIWLRGSLTAHDFIDPRYWHANLPLVRDVYLAMSENFLYRDAPGGEPLGFMALRDGHMEALFVDPGCQGRGIGKALLDLAKTRHHRLTLNVYEKNSRAVGFYIRSGFRAISRGTDPHTGEDEIRMEWEKKWDRSGPRKV